MKIYSWTFSLLLLSTLSLVSCQSNQVKVPESLQGIPVASPETASQQVAKGGSSGSVQKPEERQPIMQEDCAKGSTVASNECYRTNYQKADAQLNMTYQELIANLSSDEVPKTRIAQEAWIKYRDIVCDAETASSKGGSGYRGFLNACLARVTIAKEQELANQLMAVAGKVARRSVTGQAGSKAVADGVPLDAQTQKVAEKARLDSQQVQALLQSESENPEGGVRTIVPTYIPEGYKLETVEADWCNKLLKGAPKSGHTYRIVYRKSSNQSFDIQNVMFCGQGGADPTMSGYLDIPSKKFGKVQLNYTDFDNRTKAPRITGDISTKPDDQGASRGLLFMEYRDTRLNIEEAKKIMESMEYLDSDG